MASIDTNSILELKAQNQDLLLIKYKIETLDVIAAQQAVKERLNFSNGRKIKMLIDATDLKTVTKDARDYLGTEEAYRDLVASAIIINSPLGAMLGNFYLKFSSQPVPTKLVRTFDEGIEWLNKF